MDQDHHEQWSVVSGRTASVDTLSNLEESSQHGKKEKTTVKLRLSLSAPHLSSISVSPFLSTAFYLLLSRYIPATVS